MLSPSQMNESRSNRQRLLPGMLTIGCLLTVLGSPAQGESVQVHGFISQGFLKTTKSNFLAPTTKEGTFEFAEVGLNFGINLSEELRVGIQLFTRDLGDLGNFVFELDWGFADYTWTNNVSFRLGRIKMPYGLYGEYRDLDVVRPSVLMPQAVYFEPLRDLQVAFNGLQIYGSIGTDNVALGYFDYSLFGGAVMGPGVESSSATAHFFNNRAFVAGDGIPIFQVERGKNGFLLGGAIQWNSPWEGLILNYTLSTYRATTISATISNQFMEELKKTGQFPPYFSSKQIYTTNNTSFWVASIEYTWRDLIAAIEYCRYFGQFKSNNAPIIGHTDLYQERYYAQISYRLTPSIQISGYYGYLRDPRSIFRAFPDQLLGIKPFSPRIPEAEKEHQSYQNDFSVATRFELTESWLLKFEAHQMVGSMMLYQSLNPHNRSGHKYWQLYAIKTTLVF